VKRFTVFLTIFLLTGCTPQPVEPGVPVTVYALGGPEDRSALVEHTLFRPDGADLWAFALDGVLSGAGGRSPFPAGVTVVESNLRDGVLNIVLSEEADALTGFSLTLARACIVLTLTSLDDGVAGVLISIRGQSSEPAVLRASDFVLGALVLADTERPITLFFPNAAGWVSTESRTLVVRETDTVEWYLRYILEEMIAGPRTEGFLPVLPDGTRLLSVIVEGGVCTVNFSGEFVSNATPASHDLVLYCLVRSVVAQPGVSAVRLLVDGRPLETYGTADTSQPLTAADMRQLPPGGMLPFD
jgi:germination protein M